MGTIILKKQPPTYTFSMKILKQAIFHMIAVIALGIIIAFLLFKIANQKVYEWGSVESELPERIREENIRDSAIRVLVKTTGFQELEHDKLEVSAEGGLRIISEDKIAEYSNDDILKIKKSDKTLKIEPIIEGNRISIHSIERGYGVPSYGGVLEIYSGSKGIVIVNEVPLEEYLCSVVPSEMPASYEPEALKAQAICARCYAYNQMQDLSYPEYGAHVDDSVSFQVYNNSKRQKFTTKAVKDTEGQLLWYGDEVAMTYFYSTSGGESTSVEAWGTKLVKANEYLQGVSISNKKGKAYEEDLAWYKWNAKISRKQMEKIIEDNTGNEIGKLKNVEVTKRGSGGVALELTIWGSKDTLIVENENKIRKVLGGGAYKITKQDGTVTDSMNLLPSAFIEIEKVDDTFIVNGGGYGHGIGMSQNGANELAKEGKNYQEILEFFYPGTKVEKR